MSDNTPLNPGVGGDTIRDIDRGTAKTQVLQVDIGGANSEFLLTPGQVLMSNSVPVVQASDNKTIDSREQRDVSYTMLLRSSDLATLALSKRPGAEQRIGGFDRRGHFDRGTQR